LVVDPFVIEAETVINSAGLHASEVASLLFVEAEGSSHHRLPPGYQTYFCKGHYFGYSGAPLVKRLAYPIPPKNLAGLGVHVTVDLAGRMRFGPDTLWIQRNDDYSIGSSEKRLQEVYEAVKTYMPSVQLEKLFFDYTGIRPKISKADEPPKDFFIKEESSNGFPGFVNLLGIESPGLTSSLAIADYVAELLNYSNPKH